MRRHGAAASVVLLLAALLLPHSTACARVAPGQTVQEVSQQSLLRPNGQEVRVFSAADGSLAVSSSADVGVAAARFVPASLRISDFAELHVSTSGSYTDVLQMRAAGFAEGFVTAEMISDHWHNLQWWLGANTNKTDQLLSWLSEQDRWTRQQIQSNRAIGGDDAFMGALELLMEQFDGLVEGYAARVREAVNHAGTAQLLPIDRLNFLLLNAFGDIDDLLSMIEIDFAAQGPMNVADKARLSPEWDQLTPSKLRARIAKRGHCSAIVKVTADLSDLLIAHTTWWSYSSMLRIYKHYDFDALTNAQLRGKGLSFASYPGTLSSIDDWYILSSKMVVTETSNSVHDLSLYQLSTNQAALSWQRARIANMLSDDGSMWAQYIATHGSGTYNNQYLVIDLKKFEPYAELQPGLLTVVETMPGQAVSADRTEDLVRGYWPSYNIPVFPEVYEAMGYGLLRRHLAEKDGYDGASEELSYQLAPRAKIFRRDAGTVTNLDSLKRLTRSNGWPRDSLGSSPWHAISARGDLSPDPDSRSTDGAYDAKATNYRLAMRMAAEAVNGPTWGQGLPPFSWAEWPDVAHRGMRDVFDTKWELQAP